MRACVAIYENGSILDFSKNESTKRARVSLMKKKSFIAQVKVFLFWNIFMCDLLNPFSPAAALKKRKCKSSFFHSPSFTCDV